MYLCKRVIGELDELLHTHTHVRGNMGTPFVPLVSDLCGPITQVSQRVTIIETPLDDALHREARINQ